MNMMAMPELSGAAQLIHAQRMLEMRVLLARFERDDMEQAVDTLIAMLDRADGDCDIELNGDELDTGNAEDEAVAGVIGTERWANPGCPISDPAEDEDLCLGGDDMMEAGPVLNRGRWLARDRHISPGRLGHRR